MARRGALLLAALAASVSAQPTRRVCVRSAPNEEFSASPLNFAHWLLAHAYPTVVALDALGGDAWDAVRFPLVYGENGLLTHWRRKYEALLAPSVLEFPLENASVAHVGADGTARRANIPLFGGGVAARVRGACAAFGVGDCGDVAAAVEAVAADAAPATVDGDCAAQVSIRVPHLAFCDPAYWDDLPVFAARVRRRFRIAGTSAALLAPKIFVLARSRRPPAPAGEEPVGRSWDVDGLEALCASREILDRIAASGVGVECGTFDADTPLEAVAEALGSATALVAAHGAGLANLVFLPEGAAVYELDAAGHAAFNRPFYGRAARAAGLRYDKVWLDASGARVDVAAVRDCAHVRRDGSPITGNLEADLEDAGILPYAREASIGADVFLAIAAEVAPAPRRRSAVLPAAVYTVAVDGETRTLAHERGADLRKEAAAAGLGAYATTLVESAAASARPAPVELAAGWDLLKKPRVDLSRAWRVLWAHDGASCASSARPVTGARPGKCDAIVEWDWVLNVVFAGLAGSRMDDTLLAERGVYVVHAPNFGANSAENVAFRGRLRDLGRSLRRRGLAAILVHLSDEGGDVDDFYEPWAVVYRQYYSPLLAERWGSKVRFLPLGYASGHAATAPVPRTSARRAAWAFVGDAAGKPTREAALAALAANAPRGVYHVTSRATTGRPWRPDVWAAPAVADLHRAARVCPAPMGFESPETFRFWEALEAGCLPFVDDRDAYFPGLLGDLGARLGLPGLAGDLLPFPPVADWSTVPATVNAMTAGGGDDLQEKSAAAWTRLKEALAADARTAQAEAERAADAPMAVFVAIPKTGTRSVLSALQDVRDLSVYQGRLQVRFACREYAWWSALRHGAAVRYDGADYGPGGDAFGALRRECHRLTERVATSVGKHFDGPVIFFDHVGYLPALAARAAHVTVLREPLSWAASHFYFLRGEPPPAGLGPGSTLRLEEALVDGTNATYLSFFTEARNAQARYLCGAGPDCDAPHGQAPAALLDRFAVVGVLEDLDATFRALERTLPRVFAGSRAAHAAAQTARPLKFKQPADDARPRDEVLSAAATRRLGALFAEDALLYAAAFRRLEAQLPR